MLKEKTKFKETEIGLIPEEWDIKRIDEICETIFSGGTPNTQIPHYWNGDLPWLSSGETNNQFIYTTEKYITKEGAQNSSTKMAKKGDIVIASAGQGHTRGQTSYCLIDTYVNQSLICLRTNFCNDSRWLFYNLSNRYDELRFISESNSSRGSLTTKIIKDILITCPALNEQKAIAAVLSSLDDKIELLREQNKTLEAIAQALFKEWFIDFNFPDDNGNPYKKSGGKMTDSELGEIPEGWKATHISEIIEITDGTHDSPKPVEHGYPLITSKHINKDSIDIKNAYLISKSDFDDINRRSKVEQFDILISMIGTVGLIMPILSDQINFAIKNVGLFRTSAKLEFFEYILLTLKSSIGNNYIQQNQSGTTQKYLTLGGLRDFMILQPCHSLLQRFHLCTKSFYLKLKLNLETIDGLSNTRDSLLPKLMKGEVRVKDVNSSDE